MKLFHYFIGYGIHDNMMGAVVTAYKPQGNPDDFLSALKQSLAEIKKIVS